MLRKPEAMAIITVENAQHKTKGDSREWSQPKQIDANATVRRNLSRNYSNRRFHVHSICLRGNHRPPQAQTENCSVFCLLHLQSKYLNSNNSNNNNDSHSLPGLISETITQTMPNVSIALFFCFVYKCNRFPSWFIFVFVFLLSSLYVSHFICCFTVCIVHGCPCCLPFIEARQHSRDCSFANWMLVCYSIRTYYLKRLLKLYFTHLIVLICLN